LTGAESAFSAIALAPFRSGPVTEGGERRDDDVRRGRAVESLAGLPRDHLDVKPLPHETRRAIRLVDPGGDQTDLVVDGCLVRADPRRHIGREEP
jgi:hypothetical protein